MRGWFYLPEAPDNRVPGIFTWDPSAGARLELIGGFSPEPEYRKAPDSNDYVSDQIVGDIRPGTVYGESSSGQKLSIWDAQRGTYTAGISGRVREEFWESAWVCVGAHVPSPRQAEFSSATLVLDELYYLTEDGRFCPPKWVKIEGVDSPGEQLDNGTLLTPYVLPIIGGYRAECAVGETDDARYSVNTKATRPFVSPATNAMPDLMLEFMTNRRRRGPVIEVRVDSSVCIQLTQDAAGSAADFVDRMAPVTDLLRLATFDPCGVEAINLATTDNSDVFLLSLLGEPARPEETYQPEITVFSFADVPLDTYLTTRQRLTHGRQAGYAWNVVIGLCGYSSRFVEEYVSQSLAGAEGFHLWCLGGDPEARLNDRLRELHDRLPRELQTRLGLDVDHWAGWAVWARNHVAHGGTKRNRIIKDIGEFIAVAESVHLVTYLVVLQELGVPVEKIRDALNNHPRLQVMATRSSVVNQIDQQVSVL